MERLLITEDAFRKATHLERFKIASKLLMGISGINELNLLYQRHAKTEGVDFITAVFKELKIHLVFDEEELKNIPSKGAFITISNHPFGALDGLALLFLMCKKRTDFKVMANFLLKEIKPLENYFLTVNPFENKTNLGSSIGGTRAALNQIKKGEPLGIFPAGEVSSFQSKSRQIVDRKWNPSILKLIKKAEVPIIPVFFQGSNSLLFQVLGIVNPNLRTLALPSEFLKKKNQSLNIRIGKTIHVKDQREFANIDSFGRFLRAKTYCLGSSAQHRSVLKERFSRLKNQKEIFPAVKRTILQKEIDGLHESKILEQAEFELFLCSATQIPKLLQEIGRERELTFRAVGEGTNKSLDLDEYDLYYHHLFLWDKVNQRLAGAYRLGNGIEIMTSFGKKGFYIHSLFKIKKDFKPILSKSMEMGRSFIVKDYQQKRLPLFLLWKGIMHYILSNPEIKYLLGPVSISNTYSKFSRMIMVEFIRRFYFDNDLAKKVEPRKTFNVRFKKVEGDILLDNTRSDLKKVDQIISDIEPSHAPLPVLIKKYIKQNAKIIGFNLDPKFNQALDGLMILNLDELPASSIEDLKTEMKMTNQRSSSSKNCG